jgi:hypothetical protein
MPRTEYAAAGVEHRAGNCDLGHRSPNTNSEIGTTLSRARTRGRGKGSWGFNPKPE